MGERRAAAARAGAGAARATAAGLAIACMVSDGGIGAWACGVVGETRAPTYRMSQQCFGGAIQQSTSDISKSPWKLRENTKHPLIPPYQQSDIPRVIISKKQGLNTQRVELLDASG